MIPVLLSWDGELPVASSCPPFGANSQMHRFFMSVPHHELCFKPPLPGKSWLLIYTTAGLIGVWVKAPRSSSPWSVPQSSGLHPTEVQQAKVQVSRQVNNRVNTITALHLPTVQSYLSHTASCLICQYCPFRPLHSAADTEE